MRGSAFGGATFVACVIVAVAAAAQVTVDGTTPTTLSVSGATTVVDGGAIAGANQFHSFSEFSIPGGQTVDFQHSGPGAIDNVISRVTGSAASALDGTLRVSAPDANFFLVNPNGVLVGANAVIDVPGATSLVDADRVTFADGASFSASDTAGGSFSVADPVSFGFLGQSEPGGLFLDGTSSSTLLVNAGQAVVFDGEIAGANQFHSFSRLSVAPTEQLILFHDGPETIENVILRDTGDAPSRFGGALSTFIANANLYALNDAGVEVYEGAALDPPGALFLVAGSEIGFADGASLASDLDRSSVFSASAPVSFGFTAGIGGDIRFIDLSESVFNGAIAPGRAVFAGRNVDLGPGVDLNGLAALVEADDPLFFGDLSDIGLSLFAVGDADASLDPISGESDRQLTGLFSMRGATFSNGALPSRPDLAGLRLRARAGEIALTNSIVFNERVVVLDADSQLTLSGAQMFDSGDLALSFYISNDRLDITGSTVRGVNGIFENPFLTLSADRLTVTDSLLTSDAVGDAAGGRIQIVALDEATFTNTLLSVQAEGLGAGGSIQILGTPFGQPGDLRLSLIGSRMTADGTGLATVPGGVSIAARNVILQDSLVSAENQFGVPAIPRSGILLDAETFDLLNSTLATRSVNGAAGSPMLLIVRDAALLRDSSLLTSGAFDDSARNAVVIAGDFSLAPGALSLTIENSTIETNNLAAATAGDILLSARELRLDQAALTAVAGPFGANGGSILLRAAERADLANAFLIASTAGAGNSGEIVMFGDVGPDGEFLPGQLALTLSEATFTTSTSGAGAAGAIDVTARSISAQDSFFLSSTAPTPGDGAVLLGDGGSILLTADDLSFAGGGVSTETSGASQGGNIVITGGSVTLRDGAFISSRTNAAGDGGRIFVTGLSDVTIQGAMTQVVSTSTAPGGGEPGIVIVDGLSGDVTITDGALVSTDNENGGAVGLGGSLLIFARDLTISRGGEVTAIGSGAGSQAGGVAVSGLRSVRLTSGASISTSSEGGETGDIDVRAGEEAVVLLEDAAVTTTSESGETGGGTIQIVGTDGAPIGAVVLRNATLEALGGGNAALLQIDAGSLIVDNASTIAIAGAVDAPDTEIANTVQLLDVDFLNASEVLRNQCAVQRAGAASTLTYSDAVGPRGEASAPAAPATGPEFYLGVLEAEDGARRLALLCGRSHG